MFKKLFKKSNSLIVLHQENGISGNDAKETAKQMKANLECKVILVPFGYLLQQINSKWVLIENGKSRYGLSKEYIDELKTQLGTDVILVRHGLAIDIYEEGK